MHWIWNLTFKDREGQSVFTVVATIAAVNNFCRAKITTGGRNETGTYATRSQSQLDQKTAVVLRIHLDLLVAVRVHHHSRLPQHIIKGIMGMAMDPQERSVVKDLLRQVAHEGPVEVVAPIPFVDGEG